MRNSERLNRVQACGELCYFTVELVRAKAFRRPCEFTPSRAVVTGKASPFKSISDLKDTIIGISRHGRYETLRLSAQLRMTRLEQRQSDNGVRDGSPTGVVADRVEIPK